MKTQEELMAEIAAKDLEITALNGKVSASAGTVEELKEMRVKKQQAEADRDIAQAELAKIKGGNGEGTVDEKVRKVFQEEKDKTIGQNRTNALTAFKNAHKELFDEANDAGGLKFQAYEEKLSRINLTGLETEQDFVGAYEDALILLNKGVKTSDSKNSGNGFTPANNGGQPRQTTVSTISSTEKQLIEDMGWDEERYLKIKKGRPAYVAQLLKSRNVAE